MVMTPLVVLFLNSFKTSAEANKMALSLPKKWAFENYATVIEQRKQVSSFFLRLDLCNLQCWILWQYGIILPCLCTISTILQNGP